MFLCGCYCCIDSCCCFSRPAEALLCCAVSASALGTDLLRRVLNLENTFSTSSVLPSTSVWEVYSETAIHHYNTPLAHVSVGGLFRNIIHPYNIPLAHVSVGGLFRNIIHHYNIPLPHASPCHIFYFFIHMFILHYMYFPLGDILHRLRYVYK